MFTNMSLNCDTKFAPRVREVHSAHGSSDAGNIAFVMSLFWASWHGVLWLIFCSEGVPGSLNMVPGSLHLVLGFDSWGPM